jgi:hypothetical protein
MGIGMGALMAGLFGMNVSLKLCLPPQVRLIDLPSAYESHGRAPICLYGYVCRIEFHCISRRMGWSSKVRFPNATRSVLRLIYSTISRLAKIQKIGLSASNSRKSAGGLPLSVRQRRPESWP